mmetsp:Transcript_68531/g.137794  ORF Transcript_68531/g.137794 Transcript_68531/m.137794 type:complete len:167 (-) Transcript_68531:152-652(-)
MPLQLLAAMTLNQASAPTSVAPPPAASAAASAPKTQRHRADTPAGTARQAARALTVVPTGGRVPGEAPAAHQTAAEAPTTNAAAAVAAVAPPPAPPLQSPGGASAAMLVSLGMPSLAAAIGQAPPDVQTKIEHILKHPQLPNETKIDTVKMLLQQSFVKQSNARTK